MEGSPNPPIHEILPTELLTIIFTLVTALVRDRGRLYVLNCPLTLGGVCREWRAIAWGTPSLWATIHVRVSRLSDSRYEDLEGWVARAKDSPLNICLDNDHPHRFKDNLPIRLLNILLPHCERWVHLEMRCFSIHGLNPYFPFDKPGRLASLRTLVIWTTPFNSLEESTNVFKHATALQFLAIRLLPIYPGTNVPHAQIHLGNLTHFEAVALSAQDFRHVLAEAPCLISCRVREVITQDRFLGYDAPGPQVITAPHLRTLMIMDITSHADPLLRFIRCPALTHFHLDIPEDLEAPTLALELILDLWGCHLESLHLGWAPIPEVNLVGLLWKASRLRRLAILEINRVRQRWEELSLLLSTSPDFLPVLEWVHVGRYLERARPIVLGSKDDIMRFRNSSRLMNARAGKKFTLEDEWKKECLWEFH